MPSFLPPVVMELRAEGTQAIAEMAKVGESARAMADRAVAAAQREAAAARESAAAAKASADEKIAAADTAAKAQQEAAEKTALVRKEAAEQETLAIQKINKALADGALTAKEAEAEVAAAVEKSAAQITAAEAREAEAVKATAKAETEAAAQIKAARDAQIRADAEAAAANETMVAKHKAGAQSLVQASGVVSAAVLASAAIIGVASVEEAAKFEKATTLLVTAGGEAKSNLGTVRDGIMSIAAQTGTSTDQLAEGMYTVEKAGYRGAAGLNVLKAAAEGAKAENVDLATMTQAVTDIMLDYDKKASDAVPVTNELVAASGLAKTTMQDFAGSMAAIIPTAATAQISFAQVGGALATMTQHGESAQQSSQNLANLLTQLERPSNVASKAMQQMGIDVTDLSKNIGDENGGRGLLGTLQLMDAAIKKNMGADGMVVTDTMNKSKTATQDLQKIIAEMPPQLAQLSRGFLDGSVSQKEYQKDFKDMGGSASALGNQFLSLAKNTLGVNDVVKSGNSSMQTYVGAWNRAAGGITGARTALMLLMNDSAQFEDNINRITEAEKQNGKDIATWADTQKTFSVQLDMTKQAAANLGIELGSKLLPVATQLIHGVSDLAHGFEEGNPLLWGAVSALGALAAVTATVKIGEWALTMGRNLINAGKYAMDMASQFRTGFGSAAAAMESGASSASKFGGAMSRAMPVLAKLGTAAAVTAIGVQALKAAQDAFGNNTAAPSVEQTTNAIVGLGKATGDVNTLFQNWEDGPLVKAPSGVNNLNDAIGYLNDGWAKASDSTFGFVGHLFGVQDAMDQVKGRFTTYGQSLAQMVQGGSMTMAAQGFDQIAEAFTKQGKTAQDALDTMPAYRDALIAQANAAGVDLSKQELLEAAMGRVPEKMQQATQSTGDYVDAAGRIRPITPTLQKSLDDAGISADGLVTDLDKVRTGMEDAGLTAVNQRDAQVKLNQSMDAAKNGLADLATAQKQAVSEGKDLGRALNAQGTDFDLTTQAGQMLNDKYEAVFKSNMDFANSVKGTGADAQKEFQKRLDDTYNNLVTAGHEMGITGGKADDLARQVMGIPPGVDIHTWMDDYARQKAQQTTDAVNAIPTSKTVIVDVQVNNQGALDPGQYANAQATAQKSGQSVAFATGGLVGGYPAGGLLKGPGTGTSDSIVARVSNGEYVVKAAAVARYGVGFFDQLNNGQLASAPGSPRPAMAGAPSAAGANVTVNAYTNASPQAIASEVGWALRNLS